MKPLGLVFAITFLSAPLVHATMDEFPPLPKTIPAFSASRAQCFLPNELRDYDRDYPRIEVSGCRTPIIKPKVVVESYRPYGQVHNGSVFNCQYTRANEFSSRFLNTFGDELVEMVDSSEKDPNSKEALCISNMIYTWASSAAMTEISSRGSRGQARLDRMWTVATIALSYFKSPHAQKRAAGMPVGVSNKNEIILKWLLRLGNKINHEIVERRNSNQENNLQYWNGFSILPIAFLNKDARLFAQSKEVFLTSIDEIMDQSDIEEGDRGFLPRELLRDSKALSYHRFAALPITGMALLSQSYGCDFLGTSPWRKKQLARLLRKTIQGYYNPSIFSRMTGFEQSPGDARPLIYLANAINSSISKNIQTFIEKEENHKLNLDFGSTYKTSYMGGSFSKLVDAVIPLRSAGACTIDR